MSSTSDDHEPQDLAALAGLYAVDALEGDDLIRFEAYLASNPEAREEVAGYRATASQLAAVTEHAPPPDLRDRVMANVTGTRQDAPVVQLEDRRRRTNRGRVALGAVAAVAVLVAGIGGYLVADRTTAPDTELAQLLAHHDTTVVALTGIGSDEPAGRVVVNPTAKRVIVVSDEMPPSEPGRTYELWKVDADGVHSAGLFEPDRNGTVRASLPVQSAGATKFLITDEPDGGSPKATTPPLMEAVLA